MQAAPELESEASTVHVLRMIFTPTLLSLGLVGNLLSIWIFRKPSMYQHSTFQYLAYLSFFDLCVLVIGYGQVFVKVYFSFDPRLISSFTCRLHSFLVYFFTHSSSMILVLMSVDRALVIGTRLELNYKFSVNRIVFSMLAIIAAVNAHWLLFINLVDMEVPTQDIQLANASKIQFADSSSIASISYLNTSNSTTYERLYGCWPSTDSPYLYFYENIWPWLDLALYAFVPFVIMLACSVIIIAKLCKSTRNMRRHRDNNQQMVRRRQSRSVQITYLLITTNILFFLLVSPIVVLNAMKLLNEESVLSEVIYLLAYSNHALNFIFYGITCEKYREKLMRILFNRSSPSSTGDLGRSTVLLEPRVDNAMANGEESKAIISTP
nr:G protein-coupled receptor [Proales similis]